MPQESRYSLQIDNPPLVDYEHGAPSPRAAYRNSDIDFRDVFGGPPRRSSVHDVRYSFTEGMDSVEVSGRRTGETSVRDPWTAAEEKPVFGEAESVNRRRYLREDFFDDIFKGGESPSSTPRNVFSSSPGSRALSPARADGTGSPSLPSQFSLPDKLSKGMEYPEFGSTATAPKRGTSLDPPKISVFGFSTRAADDSKTANHPSYRPSPLSQQFSLGNQEMDDSKKKDSEVEPQFHFSIYKWANPIPLVMPLNRTNSKNLKERQGRQTSKDVHPAAVLHETSEMKVNQVLKEQIRNEKIESKPLQSFLRDEPGKADSGKKNEQQRTKKVPKNKDEVSFKKQDSESTLPKKEDVQKQESGKPSGQESTPKRRGKSKVKDFIRIFNQETPSKSKTPNSPPSRGSGREEEPTPTVGAVAGQEKSKKVAVDDEKIKISKADDSKPRSTNSPSSRSSRRKEPAATVEAAATLQEKSRKSAVDDEKINISKSTEAPEKKQDASDKMSQKEDSKSTAGISKPPPSSHSSSSPTKKNTGERRPTKKNTENIPENARATTEEADDSSQTNFTIKELSEEEQKQGEATRESEEIQATDAKIRQWARGKEGNIRSLLTTLQFVLWPGSGWKPVALMNIIEGPGVKRAYQKAMLCLHPDKLQQKGASSHQKYVAEKVFDILQEAWDHFNTLGGL